MVLYQKQHGFKYWVYFGIVLFFLASFFIYRCKENQIFYYSCKNVRPRKGPRQSLKFLLKHLSIHIKAQTVCVQWRPWFTKRWWDFWVTTGEHRQEEAQPQRQKSMRCLKRACSSSLFSSDSRKLWFTNSFLAECAVKSQTDLNVAATLGLCLLAQMEKQKDLKEGSGKACYITSFPKSPSKKNIVMDKWAVEII